MRRIGSSLVVAVALATLVGCSATPETSPSPATPSDTRPVGATEDYLPGVAADVYLPTQPAPESGVPVVLLVPGGGWQTADRTGLTPLARAVADAGMVAVNATYRAGDQGARFPVPVQDVLCAAGYAVHEAEKGGLTPGPLVVLGHSAGGHLAALAAVSGSELAGDCPFPLPRIDGMVGLAGVYDTGAASSAMQGFFGVPREADPELWASGDPLAYVSSGSAPRDLHVLLLHGDADTVVPLSQSQAFADALEGAGADVTLDVLPKETHATIYGSAVTAERVTDWVGGLVGR